MTNNAVHSELIAATRHNESLQVKLDEARRVEKALRAELTTLHRQVEDAQQQQDENDTAPASAAASLRDGVMGRVNATAGTDLAQRVNDEELRRERAALENRLVARDAEIRDLKAALLKATAVSPNQPPPPATATAAVPPAATATTTTTAAAGPRQDPEASLEHSNYSTYVHIW